MNTGTKLEDMIASGVIFVGYIIILILDIPVLIQILCGVVAILIMLGILIKVSKTTDRVTTTVITTRRIINSDGEVIETNESELTDEAFLKDGEV
ncbi:MAG: hypothetical protein ATN33_02395 [Epulopiscium sp. Nele67-Bin001]|nr:MAG: hypothetical protein BEN18_01035 [Epulopiscium sp. Nuni2H_MBin001]OON90686.1 MAG: hypothetical protein ATN33_02395 [Epulopiscium sp. Nele67-Bin001]